IKPGVVQQNQIDQLVDYLESLTPEGGCPPPTGENADLVTQPNEATGQVATPGASPAASPAASPFPGSPTAEASPVASPPAATGGQTAEIGMFDINFNPNV